MAVEAQVCPQCGAAVQFGAGQTEVVCAHCGTTVVRAAAAGSPDASVEKEVEAEKLVQETVGREQQLAAHGRPATGKIVSAQATDIFRSTLEGRAVLMSFAVEVQPDGEAAFSAEGRALVGLSAVDKYKPGTLLDVRYDPRDPAQVSIEGRHGVPGSNPEAQARPDHSQVEAWQRLAQAQAQTAEPAAEALTPAWGAPRAPGTVPVPAEFDPVTGLGAATAVYRHQGLMLLAGLSGTKPKELVLYQGGLAYHTGGKEIRAWRWEDVAAILSNLWFVASEHGGGYTDYEYTLLKTSGEKLVLDSGLGFIEVEQMIQPIKEAVYARLYPPLAQQYGAGQAVTFGPVTVHRANGLATGGKTYAWADLIDVKVDNGRLTVTQRDGHKHDVRTAGIPNIELLCRLIGVKLLSTQLWA